MNTIKPQHTLCTVALAVSLALSACGGDSAEKSLAAAKAHLAKNDAAAATIELKNALSKDGNLAEARFLLGKAMLDSGDLVGAVVELKKAQDAGYTKDSVIPELARAQLMQGEAKKLLADYADTKLGTPAAQAMLKTTLAQAYLVTGKTDLARSALNEALAAQADYAPAQLLQVRMIAMGGDLPAALTAVEGLLAKSPKSVETMMLKASLQLATGDRDGSIATYQQVVAVQPDQLAAHAALISFYMQLGKADQIKTQFEAMQKVAPKHPQTLYFEALLTYKDGKLDRARELLQPLVKGMKSDARVLQLAGMVEFDKGSDLQAQEYLAQAVNLNANADLARIALARSYMRTGQLAKATTVLEPALSIAQVSPDVLSVAGELSLQKGEPDKAEAYFTRATKANPDNARNRTALALIHANRGDVNKGMGELEQIAATDKGTTADMALIATSMRQQQYDKALTAIAGLEKKQPENPMIYTLRAAALMGKKDIAAARKSLEQGLEKHPTFFQAAAVLARLDMMDNKPEAAAKRFENILAKDPKNTQALLALAELKVAAQGKPEEVAELIGKAVAANPTEARPRVALISHYLANKDAKKALSVAQEALVAIPDQPEIMEVAGRAMQESGDFNQAITLYGKLIALAPNSAMPYLRLADVQMAAKQPEAARDSVTKGLKLQPDSLPLLRAGAMLDVQAGRQSDAMAKARTMQKAHPKEPAGYVAEGDLHANQKAWNEALTAYRNGLKQSNAPELAVRIAMVFTASGQTSELAKHSDAWLKANPKDVIYRSYLAGTAQARGDNATALALYRKLYELQPNNALAMNNLAWAMGKSGDVKSGLPMAEQANKLAPKQPALMDTLGVLLVQSGQADKGVEVLKQALALAPQANDIRLNLARAYIKAGQKSAAKTELETLEKLGDKFADQKSVTELKQTL